MERMKINFDRDWLFFGDNIDIPYAIKAGRTGMPTDGPDTMEGYWLAIAYDDEPNMQCSLEQWENVTLPHDWAVYGEYDASLWDFGGFLKTGVGCYRKTFSLPESYEGKKVVLEFDGVGRNSTVWVNGFLLGTHFNGYTPFSYDISDVARYGDEGENFEH